jgi:hypothetical protein
VLLIYVCTHQLAHFVITRAGGGEGGWNQVHDYCSHLLTYCTSPQWEMVMIVELLVEWMGNRGNQSAWRKHALCAPQIPHDLTRAQTGAAPVGNRQLTAWAIASSTYTINVSNYTNIRRITGLFDLIHCPEFCCSFRSAYALSLLLLPIFLLSPSDRYLCL